MADRIHFVAGLPRSGSTLLCNVLAQNPHFWATPTSPVCAVVAGMRDLFWSLPEARAIGEAQARKLIRPMIDGAFRGMMKTCERPVLFDKSRVWVQHIELLQQVLKRPPKVVVCVRNLNAIFASFESLYRKVKDYRVIGLEKSNPGEAATMEGRVTVLAQPNNVVGGPVNWIRDAARRGLRQHMHFVDYDKFCESPSRELVKIYEFIEEEPWEHDVMNVKQVIHEHDAPYGWGELHVIREGAIKSSQVEWKKVLTPELIKNYQVDATFWENL